ncbi:MULTISPECIES: DddA-like double-stranded DNA deaminase toxin [Actinosynnema]|uniref:DddA-like double-stranded DNA deaminase toxin n=1 Tax=Actinosynnema TaxID=40566 RepID=UPI0020A2D29F|nr:DddA-like double-stranded DNA deaminase toxin [Actinosynnema pretiosum]MCP2093917.1 SCP1.201-like deaminase [Actinosynnema pretiosum]
MGSLEAVADELESVCDRAAECRTALLSAVDGVQRAREWLERISAGSNDPEWAGLLACLAEVERGIDEVSLALSDGVGLVLDVVANLIGGGAGDRGGNGHAADEPAAPPDRIEELRRELPPPVTPRMGQKTHGRWFGPDGKVRSAISGKDEGFALVLRTVREMGMTRGFPLRAADVEMKTAAHMRASGITSATLVINHVPCDDGMFSCDRMVPVLLPAGSTLTVFGASGFRRTYHGGEQLPCPTP